jgi:hypothetical protein
LTTQAEINKIGFLMPLYFVPQHSVNLQYVVFTSQRTFFTNILMYVVVMISIQKGYIKLKNLGLISQKFLQFIVLTYSLNLNIMVKRNLQKKSLKKSLKKFAKLTPGDCSDIALILLYLWHPTFFSIVLTFLSKTSPIVKTDTTSTVGKVACCDKIDEI